MISPPFLQYTRIIHNNKKKGKEFHYKLCISLFRPQYVVFMAMYNPPDEPCGRGEMAKAIVGAPALSP
jgi:hypothetical protein